jgi:hypothetical protein
MKVESRTAAYHMKVAMLLFLAAPAVLYNRVIVVSKRRGSRNTINTAEYSESELLAVTPGRVKVTICGEDISIA